MRIALLVLAWATTFTAIEVGLDHAPPVVFGGIRSVLGGLLMAAIAWARSGPPDLRRTWPTHAVFTWWNVVAFFALQTLAIEALPSGLAAVVIYLQPLLVALLAWRLLGESMGAVKVAGLVLGLVGVLMVGSGALGGHLSGAGILYAVLAAVCWAIGTVTFKQRQARVDLLWAVAVPFVVGGVLLTVGGVLTEGAEIEWTGSFVAALAYSSVIGTALAWALWLGLVSSGEASRASAYIFTVPVLAVVLGVVVLGEDFRAIQVAGSVAVVLGVHLVNRRAGGGGVRSVSALTARGTSGP